MLAALGEVEDLIGPLVDLRRDLHANPELGFHEHRTSERIASLLQDAGIEVHRGIGGTGVVGVIRAGTSDRTIGLRADMDALPIDEQSGVPHTSRTPGVFHGCGHDGHVAMLLGAAQHLARSRRFDGTVNLIFQPAEEGLAGARAMVEDGLFERFPCDRVFALHNWPDLPAGTIATRPGPIMAAADRFEITVVGRGGHAAIPQNAPDAILAASSLVTELNTIVSRRIPPTASAVLSVTRIAGGHSHNVLPAEVAIVGTVRTFDNSVQDRIEESILAIASGVGQASGTQVDVRYDRYYPATVNDPSAASDALEAARAVANAQVAPEPAFTSEDFAFMLQACKGAYLWLGQASDSERISLHNPRYDFNDAVLGTGIALHVALAERHLTA